MAHRAPSGLRPGTGKLPAQLDVEHRRRDVRPVRQQGQGFPSIRRWSDHLGAVVLQDLGKIQRDHGFILSHQDVLACKLPGLGLTKALFHD